MSTSSAQATILDALKQLRQRFDAVKPQWDDEARRRFEHDYFDTLESATTNAVKAIEHVSELIQTVRRECGDDGPS